jgi:hypothetical protein
LFFKSGKESSYRDAFVCRSETFQDCGGVAVSGKRDWKALGWGIFLALMV